MFYYEFVLFCFFFQNDTETVLAHQSASRVQLVFSSGAGRIAPHNHRPLQTMTRRMTGPADGKISANKNHWKWFENSWWGLGILVDMG